MEMTASRWRARNFRLQISGIGSTVTRKSVIVLIILAEVAMALSFKQWCGSVEKICQYARVGLCEKLALYWASCKSDHLRALENSDESKEYPQKPDKDHGQIESPIV